MRGQAISPVLIEEIRQAFIGGESIPSLAKKHAVSPRALKSYSTRGKWADQRLSPQTRQAIERLGAASDRRAEAVDKSWRARMENVLETVGIIAEREATLLQSADTTGATWQERATLIRLLVDSIERLRKIIPHLGDSPEDAIFNIVPLPLQFPESILSGAREKLGRRIEDLAKRVREGRERDVTELTEEELDAIIRGEDDEKGDE